MKRPHLTDDRLLFREGLELILALGFVVTPVYLDVDAPHVVLGSVALLHVLQVAAGIDHSRSRSVLLWTSVAFDFAALVTVIYRNWANLTETNDDGIRTTHGLYTMLGLVLLIFINLFRWVSMQGDVLVDDHDTHDPYFATHPPPVSKPARKDTRSLVAAAMGR